MKSLVSIIIPTYNRALELKRALESVIEQTYQNWECLIVDNNSTDNTDEIIQEFDDKRIKLFKINNHGIIAASRNKAIQEAKGEYIAFLDSDDWWKPSKLEVSLEYLERGADVVYHGLWCMHKMNQTALRKRQVGSRTVIVPVYHDLICNGNALANSSVVLRRELLNRAGQISEDPELVAAEDYECWLRVSKLTDKFVQIPSVLGYYWTGGDSMTSAPRALINLKKIEVLHIVPYINTCLLKMPVWWEYAYARALYLCGELAEAQQKLRHVAIIAPKRPLIQFKILVMIAICCWRS
tara:strand:- start:78165 stop:79052 length:888 start_codon:yes stop_codon:yes gene_type:complete